MSDYLANQQPKNDWFSEVYCHLRFIAILKNIGLRFFFCVLCFFSVLPDMAAAEKSSAHSTRNSPSGKRLVPASQRKMSLTKQENELRHLNNRFASYIVGVRKLEEENRKLM